MTEFPGQFGTYQIHNYISQNLGNYISRIRIQNNENIIIQFPNNPQLNLENIHNISIENQYLLPILDYGTVSKFCFILIPPYKSLGEKLSTLSIQQKFDIVKKLIQIEKDLRALNLLYNLDTILLLNDQLELCIMPDILLPQNSPAFSSQQIQNQTEAYLMFGKLLQYLLQEDIVRFSAELKDEQIAIMKHLLGETLLPLNSPLYFSFFWSQFLMNNNKSYKNTYVIYKEALQLKQECDKIQINDLIFKFLPDFTNLSNQLDLLRTDIQNFEKNYRAKEIKIKMLSLPQNETLQELKDKFQQLENSLQDLRKRQEMIQQTLDQIFLNSKRLVGEFGKECLTDPQKKSYDILIGYKQYNQHLQNQQDLQNILNGLSLLEICKNIVKQHQQTASQKLLKNVTELKDKINQFDITKCKYNIPEKVEDVKILQQGYIQQLEGICHQKQRQINNMSFTLRQQNFVLDLKSFLDEIHEKEKLIQEYEQIEAELVKIGTYQIKNLGKFESNLQNLLQDFQDREFCIKVAFEKDQNPEADEKIKKMILDYLQIQ